MQTALTSLWCCAGWKFPSKLRIFSLPHHPPVGLHSSQGDKQTLFPSGTASYLWIHQVQSRSDWAAVRRSRWWIHRTTIERFLSLPLFLFISLSLPLFVSSSLCLFVSSSLWLFDSLTPPLFLSSSFCLFVSSSFLSPASSLSRKKRATAAQPLYYYKCACWIRTCKPQKPWSCCCGAWRHQYQTP